MNRSTREAGEPSAPSGLEPVLLVGTWLRGGHHGQRSVHRTNRSKTWPHRPALTELSDQPCQRGAVQTWREAAKARSQNERDQAAAHTTCVLGIAFHIGEEVLLFQRDPSEGGCGQDSNSRKRRITSEPKRAATEQ